MIPILKGSRRTLFFFLIAALPVFTAMAGAPKEVEVPMVSGSDKHDAYQKYLKMASELYEKRKYEEALAVLKQAQVFIDAGDLGTINSHRERMAEVVEAMGGNNGA